MTMHDDRILLTADEVMSTSDTVLLDLLREHGEDTTAMPEPTDVPSEDANGEAEVIPLRNGWYRCEFDAEGGLRVQRVDHPSERDGDSVPITIRDSTIESLPGWIPRRLDFTADAQWWLRIMQHPTRESFAAVVQRSVNAEEPELVVVGLYPDAILCGGDSPSLAFVEPHPEDASRARARLLPVLDVPEDGSFPILGEGAAGAVKVLPTSVRRFVVVGTGLRSDRTWRLVDTTASPPAISEFPRTTVDSDLLDLALVQGAPVALQGVNVEDGWSVLAADVIDGEVRTPAHVVARGAGQARGVRGGTNGALVRWARGEEEHVSAVPLPPAGDVPAEAVLSSSGSFSLQLNTCADGPGFAVPELVIGTAPRSWFLDHTGTVLNPGERLVTPVRSVRQDVISPDGYTWSLEVLWRGGDRFEGPTVLMLYGAYGIDLTLDPDPELQRWLDAGFAVAAAHTRGGGDTARHHAGIREHREGAVQDAIAAVRALRAGIGPVRASQVCLIGASAGGFLVASLLARIGQELDGGVIVNGFIDPLASLLTPWSRTRAADKDEWGDPHVPAERRVLEEVSPLRHLSVPGPPNLVVVSGNDVRVDPRLGLAWVLRYRDVGGEADLWYDLEGTHGDWGAEHSGHLLSDWISHAFERSAQGLSPDRPSRA